MQPKKFRPWAVRLLTLLVTLSPCHLVTLSPCHGAFDEVIDSPMYKAPELPVRPVERIFPEAALPLWLKVLERPEVDLKYQAAEAITKARRRGVKGLEITVA